MIDTQISFDGDLTAGLDKLSAALGESSLRAAGVAGARIFRDQAIQNIAPRSITGTIEDNIIVKRLEEESDSSKVQTYIVTVRKGKANYASTVLNVRKQRVGQEYETGGDAYYWRWVEGGHNIMRKRKDDSVSLKVHRSMMEAEFGTSSVPPHPFMRPAYESKKGQAVEAVKARLAEKISEYLGQK
jgi:hypothetical protein